MSSQPARAERHGHLSVVEAANDTEASLLNNSLFTALPRFRFVRVEPSVQTDQPSGRLASLKRTLIHPAFNCIVSRVSAMSPLFLRVFCSMLYRCLLSCVSSSTSPAVHIHPIHIHTEVSLNTALIARTPGQGRRSPFSSRLAIHVRNSNEPPLPRLNPTFDRFPGLYNGRHASAGGGGFGAMDIAQLNHLQESISHSCNSSPQKILNKFSKTFSLRRNKKKPMEKVSTASQPSGFTSTCRIYIAASVQAGGCR